MKLTYFLLRAVIIWFYLPSTHSVWIWNCFLGSECCFVCEEVSFFCRSSHNILYQNDFGTPSSKPDHLGLGLNGTIELDCGQDFRTGLLLPACRFWLKILKVSLESLLVHGTFTVSTSDCWFNIQITRSIKNKIDFILKSKIDFILKIKINFSSINAVQCNYIVASLVLSCFRGLWMPTLYCFHYHIMSQIVHSSTTVWSHDILLDLQFTVA